MLGSNGLLLDVTQIKIVGFVYADEDNMIMSSVMTTTDF
jgi:hypothetical protein